MVAALCGNHLRGAHRPEYCVVSSVRIVVPDPLARSQNVGWQGTAERSRAVDAHNPTPIAGCLSPLTRWVGGHRWEAAVSLLQGLAVGEHLDSSGGTTIPGRLLLC